MAEQQSKKNHIWIVTWNNYIHGVFDTERAAEEYADWRWPAQTRYGVKIEPHLVNAGWDPTKGGRTRTFPPAKQAHGGREVRAGTGSRRCG